MDSAIIHILDTRLLLEEDINGCIPATKLTISLAFIEIIIHTQFSFGTFLWCLDIHWNINRLVMVINNNYFWSRVFRSLITPICSLQYVSWIASWV